MAIQIWDAQAGQYKSADLARFGGSGTLTEALVWDGTQYVKVWPTSPVDTWYDDFTSPTLHERWQLLAGDYTPPGLTDAAVLGPQVEGDFELTFSASVAGGDVNVSLLDADMQQVALASVNGVGQASLGIDGDVVANSSEGVVAGPVTLRRANGAWTVLHDGDPVPAVGGGTLTAPDSHTGPLVVACAAFGATLVNIAYTGL